MVDWGCFLFKMLKIDIMPNNVNIILLSVEYIN